MEYLYLIGGLAILIFGGDWLVKGAVEIANKFQIPTLVVAMTIVSFGTSAPELLVSVKAALEGHPEISIGNILGSNIANITLVLGLTVIILPIFVKKNTIRIDWPIMMIATILFYIFILNGVIEFYEGLVLFLVLIVFNVLQFKLGKSKEDDNNHIAATLPLWKSIGLVIVGSLGLAFGAEWLLQGAVGLANKFNISEHVVGVTIIAFGTSVPELITSLIAAIKKQTDISVGNLIGSNIFNILAVLGITSMIKPITVTGKVIGEDIYWVIVAAVILLPLMLIKNKITRVGGVILFSFYVLYIYLQF